MDMVAKVIFRRLEFAVPILILLILFYSIVIPGSVSANNENEHAEPPVIDGNIGGAEYEFELSFSGGNFKLYWTILGENISIGLYGKTDGWIAIGIEPTVIMKHADIIFGWVTDDGEVGMLDCYSTGTTGPHPPDIELGGTSNIGEFAGSEENGWTSIEFTRELSTGDKYDNKIEKEGGVKIIWALGSSDDYTYKHTDRGGGIVDFAEGKLIESVPWYFHAIWMTAGLTLMLTGIIVIRYMKTKPWRIKVHKILLSIGGASVILGLISGIYMVTLSGSGHLKVIHAYMGIITIISVIVTLRLGFGIFAQPPKNIPKKKMVHRWSGRITAGFMLVNILLGLNLVGLF